MKENEEMTKNEMLELDDNPFEDKELKEGLEVPIEDLSKIPEEQILKD